MASSYEKLILENLDQAFSRSVTVLENSIPAVRLSGELFFKAFGEECRLSSNRVSLSNQPETGPKGLIISLYVKTVTPEPIQVHPFKAYQDLPDSMPYHGAYRANSEMILVPYVERISQSEEKIIHFLDGRKDEKLQTGDFSFVVFPLPKIALGYIFYLPDDEFPASATCLISANALSFMPLDGLADTSEYCSKKMIQVLENL